MKFNFKKLTLATIVATSMIAVSCEKDSETRKTGTEKETSETGGTTPSTPLNAEMTKVTLSASEHHMLLIGSNGQLFGLGKGDKFGKEDKNLVSPTLIDGKWICISASYKGSFAVKEDGTLWGTGDNDSGQLGIGNAIDSSVWVQIGKDADWVKVCTGYDHTIGLKKDGTIWGWGINQKGQIAGGDDKPSDVPRKIGNDTDWIDISASNRQSFGLKKDGSAWAWGDNYYGSLGSAQAGKSAVFNPVKIESDKKWVSIVGGVKTTAGIKEDGSLWVWGRNFHGELGNGTGNLDNDHDSNVPMKVDNNSWKKVSVGSDHLLAIRSDGTLWSWGQNMAGELGNMDELGYKTIQNKPKQVGTDTDWVDISAGHYVSFAKKSNQKVFGWGRNRVEWFGGTEEAQKTLVEIKF